MTVWLINILGWLNWSRLALVRQLAAARGEIRKAKRPSDGVGALAATTLVVINPRFVDEWERHIPDEAIKRFGHPRGWIKIIAEEADLSDKPYKLDERELAAYRRGMPIVKKPVPFKKRPDLKQGGRQRDEAEYRLREALAYQVFIRTEQGRGLVEGQRENQKNHQVPEAREAIWQRLADGVGVDRRSDLPRLKLGIRDGDNELTPRDLAKFRRRRTFEALFDEGARVAVRYVPGAKAPRDVSKLAVTAGRVSAAGDLETELEATLAHVVVLYRAYISFARKVSFLYHLWSWFRGGTLARREKRGGKPRPREMRAGQHRVLTSGGFRPAELLLIAYHADVDPLLIDPRQFGCEQEFEVARKLGRFHRGTNERFCRQEIETIREALSPRRATGRSEYDAMRDDLRRLILEIFSLQQWEKTLATAAEPDAEVTISYDRAV